jgi:NAD(P)-dependent dehydrogenase (short-subunit alcohol dehydrogenase family)
VVAEEGLDVWQLTDRTYLVTGAGGDGVGEGVCRAIRAAGGKLVLNDIDPAAATEAGERHSAVLAVPGDVSKEQDVADLFSAIAERGVVLDGIVNNAGIGLRRFAHEATLAEVERLFAVDLRGVWLVSRAFVEHRSQRDGPSSIVNIASVHAMATMRRFAVYAAAKAAVVGLTRGMAVELGDRRVRCNAIAPGFVQTRESLSRVGTWAKDAQHWADEHRRNHQVLDQEIKPDDCGWAAVFFLSDASRSITGQTLAVDAGLTAMLYEKDFT